MYIPHSTFHIPRHTCMCIWVYMISGLWNLHSAFHIQSHIHAWSNVHSTFHIPHATCHLIYMCGVTRNKIYMCGVTTSGMTHIHVWRNEGTGTQPDYLVNRDGKKKSGAIRGKKLHRNREIVDEWTVGVWEHTDSGLGAQMGSVLEPNTNAQRMSLLSQLLRLPMYTFVQNSFLRSL